MRTLFCISVHTYTEHRVAENSNIRDVWHCSAVTDRNGGVHWFNRVHAHISLMSPPTDYNFISYRSYFHTAFTPWTHGHILFPSSYYNVFGLTLYFRSRGTLFILLRHYNSLSHVRLCYVRAIYDITGYARIALVTRGLFWTTNVKLISATLCSRRHHSSRNGTRAHNFP
jgi:hypothetical protein